MHTTALVLQGLLCFFLVLGLLMVVAPTSVIRVEKEVLRFFRLISTQVAQQSPSDHIVTRLRVIGTVYVVGCIIILLNTHFTIGRLAGTSLPVWTNRTLQTETHSAAMHQQVSDLVQPVMSQYVGLVVATVADDARDVSGFGRVNLNTVQPPDGDTIFEIGSISKVFTGILLADLVAQKKLALDTPMVSRLPTLALDPQSPTNRITLQHLVTHTSGLARTPFNALDPAQLWRMITAGDPYRDCLDDCVLQPVARQAPSRAPGERSSYSNVGMGVLGLIVSQQSGLDYDRAVKTVIGQPLGLRDTGVHLDAAQRTRLATGYSSYLQGGAFYLAQLAAPWEFPNSMAGAGGLRSTANDLAIFLAANMGRASSPLTPVLRQSHQILFAQDDIQIGMGWVRDTLPQSGKRIIWHNGETGGYTSFIGFTDDDRFGVVVLGNSAKRVDDLGRKILDALVLKQ
jgi:CubicO group peptidase (beta-lactamase class C family)